MHALRWIAWTLPFAALIAPPAAAHYWSALPNAGTPGARLHHAMVYDAGSDRVILFGGALQQTGEPLNDVWVLTDAMAIDGAALWVQLPVAPGPEARYGSAVAYDAASNRLIVFGGAAANNYAAEDPKRNDVWILNHANGVDGAPAWSKLEPMGAPPPPRIYGELVYDDASRRLILVGGQVGDCAALTNDVWVLDFEDERAGGPRWQRVTAAGTAPSPRRHFSAAYDPAVRRVLLFGGQTSNCFGEDGGVWILQDATGIGNPAWVRLPPAPMTRSAHTAAMDRHSHEMIVFGGNATPGGPQNAIWRMSATDRPPGEQTWTQVATGGWAPPRADHAAVFDDATGAMIVFGGLGDPRTWALRPGLRAFDRAPASRRASDRPAR